MLTILIPSYNHARYIAECLDEACRIDIEGAKILVIDDGSTDNSLDVIHHHAGCNTKAEINVISKPNAGLVSSLNKGLGMIDTEYVYICASDDVPRHAAIRKCFEILREHRNYNFVIGNANVIYETDMGNAIYGSGLKDFLRCPSSERIEKLFFEYPSPLLLQSVIFRTEFLRKLGGWDPEIRLDDYSIFVKIFSTYPEIDVNFCYLPENQVVSYRQHDSNTYRNTLNLFNMVTQVVIKYAPIELRAASTAKFAATYFLSAIKNGRLKDAYSIFSGISKNCRRQFFIFAIRRVLGK